MDVEKVISLIRGQPSLWDKGSSEYADNTARARSWVAVGNGMFDNFKNLTEREKTKTIASLKEKWRHIRDNYVRSMNAGRSGDGGSKKRRYIYADALEFMRDSVEKRSTSGNFERSGSQSPSLVVDEELVDSYRISPSASQVSPRTLPPRTSSRKTRCTKRKDPVPTSFQSTRLENLDAPVSFPPELEDPDKAYLFSLLPNYRKLTDVDKLDFQSTVIDFFRSKMRSRYAPYPSPSQPPYNQTVYQTVYQHPFAPQTPMKPPSHSPASSSTSDMSNPF